MESPTSLLAAAALRSSPPPRVPRPRRPRLGATVAGLTAVLATVLAPAADAETRSLKLLSDGPFRTDPAGPNSAHVPMRARGRYRVTITATATAGNRSAPRRVSLRIKGSR